MANGNMPYTGPTKTAAVDKGMPAQVLAETLHRTCVGILYLQLHPVCEIAHLQQTAAGKLSYS